MHKPIHVQITAAKLVVPPTRQTTAELAAVLECDPKWIEQQLGVRTRYVSQLGDDPAELGAQAAREVIGARGAPDLILYASATVRQLLPDTSVFVARHLGLAGIAGYSVHATCLSFLVALNHASLVIAAGQYSKVLIVCAELASLSRNMQEPESAGLLGDGAAAVMVESSHSTSGPRFFRHVTWPEYAELSQIKGGGLLNHPLARTTNKFDFFFQMNGERLLRATLPKLTSFLKEMFQQMEINAKDIDWVIPHQASLSGMRLLERLGFARERIVDIVGDYGNCVAASIPMALATALSQDKLKPGDRILFLGSAAGLSLGGMLWEW